MTSNRYLILFYVALYSSSAFAYFPINLFRPWDINLRPPKWDCTNWQITSYAEIGYKTRAVNGPRDESNPLHIWNNSEDAISMLKGFADDTPMSQLLQSMQDAVGGTLIENGTRGHFRLHGDLDFVNDFGFFARYHFPHNFTFGVYVPFYAMRLKNITFEDLTPTSQLDINDVVVKEMLTDSFFQKIAEFDPSLDLRSGWERIGLGDVTLLAEWYRNFPQAKPILRNVALDIRAGLTLPTGVRTNIDDLFSIPFGNDGATGLIFGGGINVNWFDRIHGGIDFEFLQQFGNTRTRRIKTDPDQTDFLLLAKDQVFKDFGFTQRYNLFLEFTPLCGLSGSIVYQFFKHSKDTLALCSTRYSNLAANTAESLKEWSMHHAIFKIGYDFQYIADKYTAFRPQIMAFYKLPFNGKRALLVNSFGATFSLSF